MLIILALKPKEVNKITMNLDDLHPTSILENPQEGFPSLLENVFIRTFYELNIKESIGWVGIAPRFSRHRSWTAKISEKQGIILCEFSIHGRKRKLATWCILSTVFPSSG